MQLRLPPTTTRQEYIPLAGGLDIQTPTLRLKAGYLRDALNCECAVSGGYSRIDGFERFDGRPAPSAATYLTILASLTGAVALGNTLHGATSGAAGKVISKTPIEGGTLVAMTMATGVFEAGEAINVGGPGVGTVVGVGGTDGTNEEYDVTQTALAADAYRALILRVPGSGPCRGGFFYQGDVYAFRDDLAGAHLELYRATTGGWVLVSTGHALLPGGKVQTDFGNFGGGQMVYGVDGVNKAWQFDGTTMTLITTGNSPDMPTNVLVHKDHLWLSFDDNVQSSAIGDPLDWTAINGSASFRIDGGFVTSMLRQPGSQDAGAMSITTEGGTEMIYGSSAADFKKVSFEQSAGAAQYGAQTLGGQSLIFGSIGVFSISASQVFGNFAPSGMTTNIRSWVQERRRILTGSLVNRERSQYRTFFADGSALYMTVVNGKLIGCVPCAFPTPAVVAWQGDATEATEASFFGDSAGYVYRLDAGTSFDGAVIESFMTLPFGHQGGPRRLKRYRRATVECQGNGYAKFTMTYEVSYGSQDRPQGVSPLTSTVSLSNSTYWDTPGITWDTFVWDGRTLSPNTIELGGTGENIAIRINMSSAKYAALTFNSILLDYSPRRMLRQ